MTNEQERAAFEAWANGRCEWRLLNPAERYSSAITQFGWEADQAGRAAISAPAQQERRTLTGEHKAILMECRNQAMRWTLGARIPEAGAFSRIAQDLDYICAQLGVKND